MGRRGRRRPPGQRGASRRGPRAVAVPGPQPGHRRPVRGGGRGRVPRPGRVPVHGRGGRRAQPHGHGRARLGPQPGVGLHQRPPRRRVPAGPRRHRRPGGAGPVDCRLVVARPPPRSRCDRPPSRRGRSSSTPSGGSRPASKASCCAAGSRPPRSWSPWPTSSATGGPRPGRAGGSGWPMARPGGSGHLRWPLRPPMVAVPGPRPVRWCSELGTGRVRAVPVGGIGEHGARLRRRRVPVRHLGRAGRPHGPVRGRPPGPAPLPRLPRHPSLRPPVDRPQGGRPPALLRLAPAHGRASPPTRPPACRRPGATPACPTSCARPSSTPS